MKTINFLVADDHEVIREGTRVLVESQRDWRVCAMAANGLEAVTAAEKFQPDVAIIDMVMPELNGLETVRQIRRRVPKCEILVFTASPSEQMIGDAFEAGARGVILKSDAPLHLFGALKSLVDRKPYFTSHASEILFARLATEKAAPANPAGSQAGPKLTRREREIVQLLAEGKTNKDAAGALGIRVRTVETHRANLSRKLNLSSIADVVRYAVRHNIIQA